MLAAVENAVVEPKRTECTVLRWSCLLATTGSLQAPALQFGVSSSSHALLSAANVACGAGRPCQSTTLQTSELLATAFCNSALPESAVMRKRHALRNLVPPASRCPGILCHVGRCSLATCLLGWQQHALTICAAAFLIADLDSVGALCHAGLCQSDTWRIWVC